ncbi:hypothetical protein SCE1572_23735 [Sorangium cellulosum So0157-2]|uniref:Uncharacterized protein n=1 Tax=Sorangium cellulosum So0157-2 TaxID=1254432 RepID=S4XXY6_SORCE|nr:hypothetical protein SCE1572_23735 [Sorangium cellulosum So0157-2]
MRDAWCASAGGWQAGAGLVVELPGSPLGGDAE